MTDTKNLTISHVKKAFGTKQVLNDINLEIPKGSSMVIIGGSGSGKSVLLKSIIGLITPDSGSIHFDGQDITKFSRKERDALMSRFGVLFQGGALFDSFSVWENIAFTLLHNQKTNRNDAKDIAVEKLKSVGLGADIATLYPSELSGGMQKRVALARAIVTNPDVIFFDEPTTGLDPIMSDVINELIALSSKELGATTITITHDMASVRKIADQVAMLYQGQIIWQGDKDQLDDSGNEYVDQFIYGRATGPIQMQIQDH